MKPRTALVVLAVCACLSAVMLVTGCQWPLGFSGGSAFSTGGTEEKTVLREERTPIAPPAVKPGASDNATAEMMRSFFENPPVATRREAVVERKATGQATSTGPTLTGGNLKSMDLPGSPSVSVPGASASGGQGTKFVNEPAKPRSLVVWALVGLGLIFALAAAANWYWLEDVGPDKWKTTLQLAVVSAVCFLGAFLFEQISAYILIVVLIAGGYLAWKNFDAVWAKLVPNKTATP